MHAAHRQKASLDHHFAHQVMSELDISERRVPQDGASALKYSGRAIDFRVSIMPSIHGEDAVLRVLDKESMSEKFRS